MISLEKLKQFIKSAPLVIAVLALFTWLSLQRDTTTIEQNQPQSFQGPDLTLINATSVHYGEQGAKEYTLTADQVDHYEDKNSVEFSKPFLTSIQQDQDQSSVSWQASANSGLAELNDDKITLIDNVILNRDDEQQNVKLKTSELILLPNIKQAENDVMTVINSANSYVESKGIKADINTGELWFKSNVTGTFHAQP